MEKKLSACDKFVRKALKAHGCQTSKQLVAYGNRVYNESYSAGSISAALRKLAVKSMVAYSENERSQKVYWLTEYGLENLDFEE